MKHDMLSGGDASAIDYHLQGAASQRRCRVRRSGPSTAFARRTVMRSCRQAERRNLRERVAEHYTDDPTLVDFDEAWAILMNEGARMDRDAEFYDLCDACYGANARTQFTDEDYEALADHFDVVVPHLVPARGGGMVYIG